MSLIPIKGSQPSVLDLLSASSQASESRRDLPRSDKLGEDAPPRFGDVLNESSSRQRRPDRSRSDTDKQPQPVDRVENAESSDGNKPESDIGESSETNPAKQEPSREETPGKSDPSTETEAEQAAQAQGEAQAQASQHADASSAQAKSEQASVVQMIFGAAPTSVKAVQSPAELEAYAGSAAEQQAQAAALRAHQESIARLDGKPLGVLPQTTAFANATATQQQGAQGEASGGEGRGETSTTAQSATPTQTQANATAASAAFTVPDQPSGEARLPMTPAGNTVQAEATKAAPAQTLTTQGDNDSLNTARLTRGLASAVQQRGGSVTLRLTPPEMGTVRIQMQVSGTNVSASFHAESASAQTLLTQQLSQLRTALETQGMNVEKLSVQPLAATTQSNNSSQSQNDNQQQQQHQAQQQSANDGRSRGQYSGDSSNGQSSGEHQDADTSGQQHRRGFLDQLNDTAEPTFA